MLAEIAIKFIYNVLFYSGKKCKLARVICIWSRMLFSISGIPKKILPTPTQPQIWFDMDEGQSGGKFGCHHHFSQKNWPIQCITGVHSKCWLSLCRSITRPSKDQMKVMSREWSCDAAHCIQMFSPTLTSALDGAKVIFVDSGVKHKMGSVHWRQ